MKPKLTRMFTAERTGLLTVIALILFIAGASTCGRMGRDGNQQSPQPDSTMVSIVDSIVLTSSDSLPGKPQRTRRGKAPSKQHTSAPYRRNHRLERVDSIGQ